MNRALLVLAPLAVLGLMGCNRSTPNGGPYPGACTQFGYSERRCAAIVTRGLELLGIPRADVAGFDILPPPEQQGVSLGGGPIAVVRVHRVNGGTTDQVIACVGVQDDPTCREDARIEVLTGVEQSLPCTGVDPSRTPQPPGEPSDPVPVGCPSPPPTPPPAVVEAAHALRIDRKVIPIDHTGHYDLLLGTATLPNGYPSEISLSVADEQPTAYWITVLGLNVTSDVPGRPPVEVLYRAFDPYDGPEPVTVRMQFDVILYVEPSTLVLENVVVR